MNKTKTLFIFALFIVIWPNLKSQNIDSLLNNKRVYQTESIGLFPLPKIDGFIDDEIWKLGKWQGDFTQQEPNGGAKPSEITYFKVLYDRSNLFVAIICQDKEPEKIRNILGIRDSWGGDMARYKARALIMGARGPPPT